MKAGAHGISGKRQTWRVVAAAMVAVAVIVMLAGCGSVRLPGQHLTLQRDGGIRMTLSLACPASQAGCDISRLAPQTRAILQQRAVQGLGVADAVTQLNGDTAIVVELPGYTNGTQANAVLGARGEVDVIDTGGMPLSTGTDVSAQLCVTTCTVGQYKLVFTGAQLDRNALSASLDRQSNQPVVIFAFTGPYKQQFGDYTRQHIGQYLTIAVDGIVVESATIQSEIDGTGQITGLKNMDEAQALVTKLKYQALPLAVTVTESVVAIPSTK